MHWQLEELKEKWHNQKYSKKRSTVFFIMAMGFERINLSQKNIIKHIFFCLMSTMY